MIKETSPSNARIGGQLTGWLELGLDDAKAQRLSFGAHDAVVAMLLAIERDIHLGHRVGGEHDKARTRRQGRQAFFHLEDGQRAFEPAGVDGLGISRQGRGPSGCRSWSWG